MSHKDDFKDYLKAVIEDEKRGLPEHPTRDELIDYGQQSLDDVRRRDIESHIAGCEACLEESRNINAFFAPAVSGESSLSEVEIRREWKGFLQHSAANEQVAEAGEQPKRRGVILPSWVALAVAASLILAVALVTILALRLGQKSRELELRSQNALPASPGQFQAIEDENRRLQERAGQDSKRLEEVERENQQLREQGNQSQLARLRQPEMNASVHDLYSRDFAVRSGGDSSVNTIRVAPSARVIVLILNGDGLAQSSDYRIELVNSQGQVVWQGAGLKRDRNGNFTIALDRSFLKGDKNILKLYGQRQVLAEYIVAIK